MNLGPGGQNQIPSAFNILKFSGISFPHNRNSKIEMCDGHVICMTGKC